jgi:hypothetical protein
MSDTKKIINGYEKKIIDTVLQSNMITTNNGNFVFQILAENRDFENIEKKYHVQVPTVHDNKMYVQIIYRYNKIRTIFDHEDGKTPVCSADFKKDMNVRIEMKMNMLYISDEGKGMIWMAQKITKLRN